MGDMIMGVFLVGEMIIYGVLVKGEGFVLFDKGSVVYLNVFNLDVVFECVNGSGG